MPKIVAKKEDWIKLGYKRFAEKGITGIVIESMAKDLSCNKSSFYWHFKSKKAFITDLINYWIEIETNQVIAETETSEAIHEKVKKFIEVAFRKEPYLEFIFFLKRYAQNNPEIQRIIDDIDGQRLQFTSGLLEELGYSKEESKVKARLFYNYLIGYHEMLKNKEQPKYYLEEVIEDLNHFINLKDIQ